MKIRAMGQIFSAVILTAVFRLGTIALLINHVFALRISYLLIPAKLIIMVPPIGALLCVKKKFTDIRQELCTEYGVKFEMSFATSRPAAFHFEHDLGHGALGRPNLR